MRTLLLRFMKAGMAAERSGKSLLSIDVAKLDDLLSTDEIEIGTPTRNALMKDVNKAQHKGVILRMRKFYQTASKYLLTYLLLGNKILKDLESLHPLRQKSENGVQAIK